MSPNRRILTLGLVSLPLTAPSLAGCAALSRMPFQRRASVTEARFGTLASGEAVRIFTLTNERGSTARIMTWGAALQSLTMPDREGRQAEMALGLDTLDDYVARSRNFGTTVGRYAGRIENGRFELDGRTIQLEVGNGLHSTHGGPVGFAKRNWSGRADETAEGSGVTLTLVSVDGDQGFPGRLTMSITYRLTHDDRLTLDYLALTDAPTVLNPTHHSYFNLSGDPTRAVTDHLLEIEADAFAAYDARKIVTGELRPVAGTPFDFRDSKPLGQDMATEDEQLQIGGGYDHSFAVGGEGLRRAGRLTHDGSGRSLEVWTTEPALHVYAANTVELIGRGGVSYRPYCGVALETQHFQNSPNRPEFPSTVLRPGETFRSRTEYRFAAR
jgi:aldose 1-epimerase